MIYDPGDLIKFRAGHISATTFDQFPDERHNVLRSLDDQGVRQIGLVIGHLKGKPNWITVLFEHYILHVWNKEIEVVQKL